MARVALLGELELLVLLAVARLAENAYGMTVRRELETRAQRSLSIGAVYATLTRLEQKGLVRTWESEPEPVRGGRARRHYLVTAAGTRALKRATLVLGRMLDGLDIALLPGGAP